MNRGAGASRASGEARGYARGVRRLAPRRGGPRRHQQSLRWARRLAPRRRPPWPRPSRRASSRPPRARTGSSCLARPFGTWTWTPRRGRTPSPRRRRRGMPSLVLVASMAFSPVCYVRHRPELVLLQYYRRPLPNNILIRTRRRRQEEEAQDGALATTLGRVISSIIPHVRRAPGPCD